MTVDEAAALEAEIKQHHSLGAVWNTGEAIWWYEPPKDYPHLKVRKPGRYGGMLCIRERELGPRGGIREPAHSVTIEGPSWASVKRAVRSLGFYPPRVTVRELREMAARR